MAPSADHADDDIVKQQYDDEQAAQFYQVVMGDGDGHLHYGIYDTGDESFIEAAENSVTFLSRTFEEVSGCTIGATTKMLDAGSGNGGTAHKISARTGASITCVNLCAGQNAENERIAKELGLQDKISVHTGSYDSYPKEWEDRFDVIWSQDAFLHAPDKDLLLSENWRVVKPGGFLVMSDIMASANAPPENLQFFLDRLHVDHLLTADQWSDKIKSAGFQLLHSVDLTEHLKQNYVKMIDRIKTERERLDKCSDDFLTRYSANLQKNVDMLNEGGAQTWYALVIKKPSTS